MPRPLDPSIRAALIERAAAMLARREPVTLRSVVEGLGVSTIALYTYFGGMPGLWRAVRQEGFTRLVERLAEIPATPDAVRDLAALSAAYSAHALAEPDLYRAMFDAAADLDDPDAAGRGLALLTAAAARAVETGRLDPGTDAAAVAVRIWVSGHGLLMLVLTGVLPSELVGEHGPRLLIAQLVAAGADPASCERSVGDGWPRPAGPRRADTIAR